VITVIFEQEAKLSLG